MKEKSATSNEDQTTKRRRRSSSGSSILSRSNFFFLSLDISVFSNDDDDDDVNNMFSLLAHDANAKKSCGRNTQEKDLGHVGVDVDGVGELGYVDFEARLDGGELRGVFL